jgi:hypothetical protein
VVAGAVYLEVSPAADRAAKRDEQLNEQRYRVRLAVLFNRVDKVSGGAVKCIMVKSWPGWTCLVTYLVIIANSGRFVLVAALMFVATGVFLAMFRCLCTWRMLPFFFRLVVATAVAITAVPVPL